MLQAALQLSYEVQSSTFSCTGCGLAEHAVAKVRFSCEECATHNVSAKIHNCFPCSAFMADRGDGMVRRLTRGVYAKSLTTNGADAVSGSGQMRIRGTATSRAPARTSRATPLLAHGMKNPFNTGSCHTGTNGSSKSWRYIAVTMDRGGAGQPLSAPLGESLVATTSASSVLDEYRTRAFTVCTRSARPWAYLWKNGSESQTTIAHSCLRQKRTGWYFDVFEFGRGRVNTRRLRCGAFTLSFAIVCTIIGQNRHKLGHTLQTMGFILVYCQRWSKEAHECLIPFHARLGREIRALERDLPARRRFEVDRRRFRASDRRGGKPVFRIRPTKGKDQRPRLLEDRRHKPGHGNPASGLDRRRLPGGRKTTTNGELAMS